tara:strand:- start:48 stop:236 length:189 start_codon:yes stop_codon:yes gene_type:complete
MPRVSTYCIYERINNKNMDYENIICNWKLKDSFFRLLDAQSALQELQFNAEDWEEYKIVNNA